MPSGTGNIERWRTIVKKQTALSRSSTAQQKNSWPTAFGLFLKEEKVGLVPKVMLRFLPAAYVPWGVANDVVLPGLGFADDLPTAILIGYIMYRVGKYRRLTA